jgi:hypothetical protein
MSSIGKTGRPLAVDLLDVELVEALDLGAREEELCTEGGSVQPNSRGGHSLEDLKAVPVRPRGRATCL